MGLIDSILFIVLSITLLLYQSQLLHLPIVSANDTLMPGDELSDTSTLASSNGIYTIGFYTITPSGTTLNLTYLGIWLTNQQGRTLWTANRDQPIDDMDAILTMDASSGILRVKNQSGATLFDVSDGLGNKNNTRAVLEDSGNFIVYDIVTNGTIWESFDHPTDTSITGMKLGYNLTAKKNWELTSSANNEVPTSGAFTMRLEQYQKSPHLLIYRREELYWASSPWNKTTKTFQFLDNLFPESPLELTYDPSGTYLIVQLASLIMKLSPTGDLYVDDGSLTWTSTLDFCYGYGSDGNKGCVDAVLPQCRNDDVYQWASGNVYDKISPNDKIDDNSSINLGDCMERCWNDCDCISCSTYNANGTGCIYGRTEPKQGEGQVSKYILSKQKDSEETPDQFESPKFQSPKNHRQHHRASSSSQIG